MNSDPACRPNVAAVCLVITTWSVAAGDLAPGSPVLAAREGTGVATGKRPLSSRTCGPNGCRSVTSILTGVQLIGDRVDHGRRHGIGKRDGVADVRENALHVIPSR